jgi:hypothetical protein
MPSLRIDGLRTVNQGGQDATLFDPFSDAISLTMDVTASADLLALNMASFTAYFQIFDPRLHTVVVNHVWGSTFNWGQWFWISAGNNWGPPSAYETASRWGLNWSANSIFGFRGMIKASYIPPAPPGSGWSAVDAFDVSPFRWFRLKEVFSL